jgi:outer membrane protein assembly factor BamB
MKMRSQRLLQLLLLALLSAFVLTSCSAFKSKKKEKPGEPTKLVNFTPTVTVKKLWSVSVGKGEKRLGLGQQPAVAEGHVYAAAVAGGVSAFDLESGKQLWNYPSKLNLSGGPGVGSGLVVVGSLKGDIIALDAATGAEQWTAKVSSEVISAPAIGGGMVFVHSSDGRITGFDASNGERSWFYNVDAPPLTVRGNSGITLGPGILFVGGDDGTLTALNMNDGRVMWVTPVAESDGRSELDRMADVDSAPVLEGTLLFASSYKKRTVAIDGPSGEIMWVSEHGGAAGIGVSNSALVISDRDGNVSGLDKNTGGSLWQQSGLVNRTPSAPAVQGDYAVVGDFDGIVHWMRLNDGAFAARSKVGSAVLGHPVVVNDILLIQSTDGKLTAFTLQQ